MTYTLLLSSLVVVLVLVLGGCRTQTRLGIFERRIDTDSKLKAEFHRIPDDPEGLGPRFPSFVIGFEKTYRRVVSCPDKHDTTLGERIDLTRARGADPRRVQKKIKRVVNDRKCIFLSHVFEYTRDSASDAIVHHSLYNLYERAEGHAAFLEASGAAKATPAPTDPIESAYPEGWAQLDKLANTLRDRLTRSGATHVFLYTFGWNSGQTEALRNFNSLHLRLLRELPQVRALPILVTWPSHWWDRAVGVLSYRNKANDADELGAVFLNALMHRVIPYAIAGRDVRTVAIGHSFGARALTRALCSERLLTGGETSPAPWDLVIAVQGAFSVSRFLDWSSAHEGSPCVDYARAAKKVVLTWSSFDTANPVASWSRHVGGRDGYVAAKKYSASKRGEQAPIFSFMRANQHGDLMGETVPGSLIDYIDASSVVRFASYVKGGGAHSDIYNIEAARLIADVIARYASR